MRAQRYYTFEGYHPDDGLEGGRWVLGAGRVLRWEFSAAVINTTLLLACPTCHAKVSETCRTRSAHTTTPHDSRLAPRLCQCGAAMRSRARYCDLCRVAANRRSKRESQRRIRAAQKEAA